MFRVFFCLNLDVCLDLLQVWAVLDDFVDFVGVCDFNFLI